MKQQKPDEILKMVRLYDGQIIAQDAPAAGNCTESYTGQQGW